MLSRTDALLCRPADEYLLWLSVVYAFEARPASYPRLFTDQLERRSCSRSIVTMVAPRGAANRTVRRRHGDERRRLASS